MKTTIHQVSGGVKNAVRSLSQTCKPVMVALGLTIAGLGESNAQWTNKAYKHITQQANKTIVDIFHVDHTHYCDTTNNGGYAVIGVRDGTNGTFWVPTEYEADPNLEAMPNLTLTLEGTPYQYQELNNSRAGWTSHYENYLAPLWPNGEDIVIRKVERDYDDMNDWDTLVDNLWTRFELPHTMVDQHGNAIPIPIGTTAYLNPRPYNNKWQSPVVMRYTWSNWRQNVLSDPDGDVHVPMPDVDSMVLSTKDIAKQSHNASVLYPNPSSGTVYYNDGDHQSHEKFQYVLYNTAGQKIWAGTLQEDKPIELNVDPGMYMLQMDNGDTKRVIKQ